MPIYGSLAGSPRLALSGFDFAREPIAAAPFVAGGEPMAFAVHLQDVDMMSEPFGAEDRSPFSEWRVAVTSVAPR